MYYFQIYIYSLTNELVFLYHIAYTVYNYGILYNTLTNQGLFALTCKWLFYTFCIPKFIDNKHDDEIIDIAVWLHMYNYFMYSY